MKAQKNTVAEAIKQLLLLKPRTRKEIVKFVKCDIHGMDKYSFDEAYKNELRGYYSTFFRDVQHKGNIEKIGNKYQVTKSCLEEGNGLWSMNKDRKIELLEAKISNMNNQWSTIREQSRKIHILEAETQRLYKGKKVAIEQNDECEAEIKHLRSQLHHESGYVKRYAKKTSTLIERIERLEQELGL